MIFIIITIIITTIITCISSSGVTQNPPDDVLLNRSGERLATFLIYVSSPGGVFRNPDMIVDDRFYIALFSALLSRLTALACDST